MLFYSDEGVFWELEISGKINPLKENSDQMIKVISWAFQSPLKRNSRMIFRGIVSSGTMNF